MTDNGEPQTAAQVILTAKDYQIINPDPASVLQRACTMPQVYFAVSEVKCSNDVKALELQGEIAVLKMRIETRKAQMYEGFRGQENPQTKKPYTQGDIEALYATDQQLLNHHVDIARKQSAIDKVNLASRLHYHLLESLRMADAKLDILLKNQQSDKVMSKERG